MKSRPAIDVHLVFLQRHGGSVVDVSGRSTTYAYSSKSSTLGRCRRCIVSSTVTGCSENAVRRRSRSSAAGLHESNHENEPGSGPEGVGTDEIDRFGTSIARPVAPSADHRGSLADAWLHSPTMAASPHGWPPITSCVLACARPVLRPGGTHLVGRGGDRPRFPACGTRTTHGSTSRRRPLARRGRGRVAARAPRRRVAGRTRGVLPPRGDRRPAAASWTPVATGAPTTS